MGKKKDAEKAARKAERHAEAAAAAAAEARRHGEAASTGFVVPDELRRVGEMLIAKANSPKGREMIASGLALAATAAAANAGRQRRQQPHAAEERPIAPQPPASPIPPIPPAPPKPGVGGTQEIDPQAVADAIGDAAGLLMNRLFGPRRSM